MIKFLRIVFCVFSFLYPYSLHERLLSTRNVFYTLWIRNFIGHLGECSSICYPYSLQGGGLKNISTLRQHPNFNSEHSGTLNGTLNPTQGKVLQYITLHQGTNAQHIIDELTIPRDTILCVKKFLASFFE